MLCNVIIQKKKNIFVCIRICYNLKVCKKRFLFRYSIAFKFNIYECKRVLVLVSLHNGNPVCLRFVIVYSYAFIC